MKKLTAVTLFALLASSSVFAKKFADEITEEVRSAFQKNFINATDVNWKKQDAIYMVSFRIGGQGEEVSAIYKDNGEFVSAYRHQSIKELPLRIMVSLQGKYPGYRINGDVLESFSNTTNETTYYLDVENDKTELKLHSDASGNFTVEDRIKKKV